LSLKDTWVEVTTHDGRVVRGRLAGSDDTTATIVSQSGEVVPLEIKDAVALKQVTPPTPPPPTQPVTLEAKDAGRVAALEQRYGAGYGQPKGKKMHTAGAVVLSLGLTQAVLGVGLGIVSLAFGGDEVFGRASVGLLLSGGVAVAVGAPLTVKGKARRRQYYDWLHQQEIRGQARFTPGYVPLRSGGGLSMRIAF
jgi:small nuclear ribonucleoprotein (snRNP)-like protein